MSRLKIVHVLFDLLGKFPEKCDPYQLWHKISKCNLIKTINSILQIKHLEILKYSFNKNK